MFSCRRYWCTYIGWKRFPFWLSDIWSSQTYKNCSFLKVESKELYWFKNNSFITCEIDNNTNIGVTNSFSPNSMLIDVFKEMTSNLGKYCTIEDINEEKLPIRLPISRRTHHFFKRNSGSEKTFDDFDHIIIFEKGKCTEKTLLICFMFNINLTY